MNTKRGLKYAFFWYKAVAWGLFLLGGPIAFIGFSQEAKRYQFRSIAVGVAIVCVIGPMAYRDLRSDWAELRGSDGEPPDSTE